MPNKNNQSGENFSRSRIGRDNQIGTWLLNNALIVVVVIMVIFSAIFARNFSSWRNLSNIILVTSIRFVIALGVSGSLITRGTDLSAGRIVGISAVTTAVMLQRPDVTSVLYPQVAGSPIVVALLAAMAIGLFFGVINGLIVAYLKVPPFIATLGMQIVVYGLNMVLSQNVPIGSLNKEFNTFGTRGITIGPFTFPYIAFVAVTVGVLMYILYTSTRHGKYMYAIGGNEIAAEVSGVNVRSSLIRIYSLAGMLYGLAGFILTAKTGSAAVSAGTGYELEAIAAATIGGVSTAGGVGTVPGILTGVLIFELLKTSLQFLGITPEMTNVFQGIVIVVAVALDIRKTTRKK